MDESQAEEALREWAGSEKITTKTVDLLIKEGFSSMEALILVDREDLLQTKIPRGQQKLLLKALLPMQPAATPRTPTDEETMAAAATTCADDSGLPRAQDEGVRPREAGDPYTRLMAEHLRSMQSGPATATGGIGTGPSVDDLHRIQADGGSGRFPATPGTGLVGTLPGTWLDPQVHLLSAASGRSTSSYHDIIDFACKDMVEEEVVAGTHEGRQIIIKSGAKPKLDSLTLSQWSIANLAILYKLLGEGKLDGQGMVDYLSYTTKMYQLTQRYENVSVYFYDREYRKMQACHKFRWGTDVPHLQTMQLTPRASRNNGRPPPPGKQTLRAGPVTPDGRPICKLYNTHRGCGFTDSKFVHACSYRGCGQTHSSTTHSQGQSYGYPR